MLVNPSSIGSSPVSDTKSFIMENKKAIDYRKEGNSILNVGIMMLPHFLLVFLMHNIISLSVDGWFVMMTNDLIGVMLDYSLFWYTIKYFIPTDHFIDD